MEKLLSNNTTDMDVVVVVLSGNNLKADNKGYNKRETEHQSVLCLNIKLKTI